MALQEPWEVSAGFNQGSAIAGGPGPSDLGTWKCLSVVQFEGHLLCDQTDPISNSHMTAPSYVTSGKLIGLSGP